MAVKYPTKPIESVGARRTTKGGVPQKYFLDDAGRKLIQALYDGSPARNRELHRRLGAPSWIICKWATEMGLARHKFPRWTEDEVSYLEKHFQSKTVSEIATHLGRTENAVHVRAAGMGLSKTEEGYTLKALCEGLGCHGDAARSWVKQGWLKGERRKTDRDKNGEIWLFTDKAIRDFLRAHPMEIDLWRVDQLWFLDVCLDLGALDNPMNR